MVELRGAIRRRVLKPANYAYVVTRVRAKKPKLLPREEYTKLLAMDVNEIARYLEEGEYKQEILQLANQYSGALLVETATRLNLANTYRGVLELTSGELHLMLLTYLARYDVYNVKTILRGRFAGVSEEEITRNLIPAGTLGLEELEGLARLQSLDETIEALKSLPFGEALKETPASIERLTEIENNLDRHYYAELVRNVPETTRANRALREFMRLEVDVVNLKTILRLRAAGVEDVEDLILANGKDITPARARRLLHAAPQEFVSEVEATHLTPALPGIRETLEGGDLNPAMTALERFLVDAARPFGQRNPLSILPVIDFILRKRREVDNLRIIAYGKSTGLPDEVLEQLVVT